MKTIIPILLAAALTACAAKEPLPITAADTCPPVPKCTDNPPPEIKTTPD